MYYGIRPEYVAIDHTGSIGGTVVVTENLGTSYLVTVDLGSTQVRGTVEEGFEPAQGDTVALTPTARRVLLFDRAEGTLIGSEGAP